MVALVTASLLLPAGRADAATTINFDDHAEGLVTTDYRFQGIVFPMGVYVGTCQPANCDTAFTGTHVARPLYSSSELVGDRIIGRFGSPQTSLSIRVRSNRPADADDRLDLTLVAYDAGDNEVYRRRSTRLPNQWESVEVSAVKEVVPPFSRFELYGGLRSDGIESNNLAIDDIVFDGVPAPPQIDRTPPSVRIDSPDDGETITTTDVSVSFRTSDDSDLRTVTLKFLYAPEGSNTYSLVYEASMCGTSSVCPNPFNATRTVEPPSSLKKGRYALDLRACDGMGNCWSHYVRITYDPPRDVILRIHPHWMEVNQGIASNPGRLPFPGETVNGLGSSVPILPGKNTLVRAYLFADGETAAGYTSELYLKVERRDGSLRTFTIPPNGGASTITPPVWPGSSGSADELAYKMRTDLTGTLNYIIPEGFIEDARWLELGLHKNGGAVTGRVQITLGTPSGVGINAFLISYRGGPRPPTSAPETIASYLRTTYPVSDVKVLSTRNITIFDGAWILSKCDGALWELWNGFGGDDAPNRGGFEIAHINPTVGIISEPLGDANGCAYVGDAADIDYRIGGTSVTRVLGDTAAQEIGHSLGLVHAGNDHGESDGGDAEPWPYPHGGISGSRFGDFGLTAAATTAPSAVNAGQWRVSLVDPCPVGDDLTKRRPCSDHSIQAHDFMSYGSSSTPIPEFTTGRNRWVSPLTYSRLHRAIAFAETQEERGDLGGVFASDTATTAEPARVDSILVGIEISEDGDVTMSPLFRKAVPTTMLADDQGSYSLNLYNDAGRLLSSTGFDVKHSTSHVSPSHVANIAVPFVPGVAEVAVLRDGVQVQAVQASAHTPTVEVHAPNGGEILAEGTTVVRWEGSDADGDDLTYLVQYSPDGGTSWQGIGMTGPGDPTELDVTIADMIPGRRGLIRVVASDGVNLAVAESDCGFSLGTAEAPICAKRIDIKPNSCPNRINPNDKGVLQVAIPGDATFDVRGIDVSAIRLEGVAPLASIFHDRTGVPPAATCPRPGPDGYEDLVLTFDMDAVGAAIAPIAQGETRTLHLAGTHQRGASLSILDGFDIVQSVANRS